MNLKFRSRSAGILLTLIFLVAVSVFALYHRPSLPSIQPHTAASRLAAHGARTTPRQSSMPSAGQLAAPCAGCFVHVFEKGESLGTIARRYLDETSFLTLGEFESSIRQVNGIGSRNYFKPGEKLVIPGLLTEPVVEHPIPVAKDFEIRGIYLTGYMAGSERGINLIRRWREGGGNAVIFDIKDMDGIVNVPFHNPLAPKAQYPAIRSLPKFAHFVHSLGLHAVARIALFRDANIAQNHPQLAPRSRKTGKPWQENGKQVWTDPSRREVQDYDIALARTVAEAGVDEIQFDYVRFPAEGDQKDAVFAFQSEHPAWKRSDVINDFLRRAYAELHPLGVLVSLDVFGVMAWQRSVDLSHTGQDIPGMVRYCDVLSPMIYPSHFFHMDGYKIPGDAPEHFIGESMDRFSQITASNHTVLRPWLQAFAWRTPDYSPAYIVKQVAEAHEKGGIGFLFWNARNDYSKVFTAMASMREAGNRYFRGDEIQAESPAQPAPLGEPAKGQPVSDKALP